MVASPTERARPYELCAEDVDGFDDEVCLSAAGFGEEASPTVLRRPYELWADFEKDGFG